VIIPPPQGASHDLAAFVDVVLCNSSYPFPGRIYV
jgi:hypothetical protein